MNDVIKFANMKTNENMIRAFYTVIFDIAQRHYYKQAQEKINCDCEYCKTFREFLKILPKGELG